MDATEPITVLIVEDDEIIRMVAADFFQDHGYHVLEAATGEAALGFVDEPIDVVFTDIQLGGDLDGWDVGQRFQEKHPGLAVVYTSGATPPRNGAPFFAKPYDLNSLTEICRRLARH